MEDSTDTLEGVAKDLSEGGLEVDVELVQATIAAIDRCLRGLGRLCHPDARKQEDEVEIAPLVNCELTRDQYQMVLLDDAHAEQDEQILAEPLTPKNSRVQMEAMMRDLDRRAYLGLRPAPKPSCSKKRGSGEETKCVPKKTAKKKAVSSTKKVFKDGKKRTKKKMTEGQLKRKLHSEPRLQI